MRPLTLPCADEAATQAAILNALPANIALLDAAGVIISVNEAWRRFASVNLLPDQKHGTGSNYLDICERTAGDVASWAHQAAAGIRSVLCGAAKNFTLEYPCHSPTLQRWFLLTVAPLAEDRAPGAKAGAIVMHLDITQQKQARMEVLRLNANLEKLSLQLVNAQEQERISLARELHDDLGQRLTLLKIKLHHLRGFLTGSAAQLIWKSADTDVAALMAQIRAISVSLRPPALDYLGLESALRQLLERQFEHAGIDCIFEYAGLPDKLAPSVELTVYRIIQQGIANIARHAHATRVVVEINGGETGAELELIIRDNGIGFDAADDMAARAGGAGSGLRGMKERVELLGGNFNLETAKGQGTRIVVSLRLIK